MFSKFTVPLVFYLAATTSLATPVHTQQVVHPAEIARGLVPGGHGGTSNILSDNTLASVVDSDVFGSLGGTAGEATGMVTGAVGGTAGGVAGGLGGSIAGNAAGQPEILGSVLGTAEEGVGAAGLGEGFPHVF